MTHSIDEKTILCDLRPWRTGRLVLGAAERTEMDIKIAPV